MDAIKDPTYKPCYVAGATGLPSLDNIPSVADLTASFAARKEERLKQEAEKKEAERRVSAYELQSSATASVHNNMNSTPVSYNAIHKKITTNPEPQK